MSQFDYIIDRIEQAEFCWQPFRFLYIRELFNDQHWQNIVNSPEIRLDSAADIHALIRDLQDKKYSPEPFPGCTTSIQDYLSWYLSGDRSRRFEDGLLEGFGLAFRLREYANPLLKELVEFFNSKRFHAVIKNKFQRTGNTRVETAIQKYMSGYEISPHPDIRKKCLTYMININTDDRAEDLDLHTHLMRFRPHRHNIYEFWQQNPRVDRCWVPWDWCEDVFVHRENNSMVMFAPDDTTLHAVKLDYDQLGFQRTQIYGNLWYTKGNGAVDKRPNWRQLEKMLA